MLNVSIKQLMESISEATEFSMPEMNEGTEYLFNNVLKPLSNDENVAISSIAFDRFEFEDLAQLEDLYFDVFEKNSGMANDINRTLRQTKAVARPVSFI